MLSPGIHSFPFKLGLPPGLPSTFLGKSGWVQYYCKAALREPNSLTHKNQQVFIVMNPIDLNMEPSILSVVKIVHTLSTRITLQYDGAAIRDIVRQYNILCLSKTQKAFFLFLSNNFSSLNIPTYNHGLI